MKMHIPPGVFDIIPEDSKEPWRSSYLWNYVEAIIRGAANEFGFLEIRTPTFERTELFQRSVGETSDIVSKEMYVFEDKGGRSMCLRPEGTAPVMRSYIENQMQAQAPLHKFFYIGPMFRYDRPQAGRYRQHHQFGAEVIGVSSPEQDVEVMDLLYTIYTRLGLKDLKISINSIGDPEDRLAYREALKNYLRPHLAQLSGDSKVRFEANPLRILDSKDPTDKEIVANAPSILDFLSSDARLHFQKVCQLLEKLNIPYQVDKGLVRGLDYYNRTVFEVLASELGAQNSIGGGGRYDGLLKTLGGPDLPTFGFGAGIERTLQTMLKQGVPLPTPPRPLLFLISLGDDAKSHCYSLLHQLRQNGISCQMDFTERKLQKVMQYANQIQVKYVVVIGENELKANEVELKEMSTGVVKKVSLNNLPAILAIENRKVEFMNTLEEMSKPFENAEIANFFIDKVSQSLTETKRLAEQLQHRLKS